MSGTKSSKNEWGRPVLRVLFALLLISPYLIWIFRIQKWAWPDWQEWTTPIFHAFLQASLSAIFSFALGFMMFCGLQCWARTPARGLVESGLLFPNLLPPLFFIMSLIGLGSPWGGWPQGLGAVVFAHSLLNAGLVAVALDRLIFFKLGPIAETAWVLGARPYQFWREVAWPYLRSDLATIFLFVFSLCFTSFAIPLMLSGERPATLEIAIYDTIRMEGRWDKAVILALLQALLLFAMALAIPQSFWPQRPARRSLGFLAWRWARSLPLLPAAILFLGWAQGFGAALRAPAVHLPEGVLVEAILTTAVIAFSVGLMHLLLFLLVAWLLPHERLTRFLNGYLAPSPAITGFGLLLIPIESDGANLLKLVIAITLISFPLLYRWIVHSSLAALQRQVIVARSLGAGWGTILFEVIWPQTAPQMLSASGVAGLWAAGDFALSGLFLGESQTLPLLLESMLNNYQLEAAQLMLVPLVAVGLLTYVIFRGASRYVSR